MPISPARSVAFDILLRVERDGAWAGELLHAPRLEKLSREDRALCHELVMTTLRWQSALDARIAHYSSQPISRLDAEVRIALRLGTCQLFYLDRIPSHAAVHESVELVKSAGKRSAAPFANAVLRKLTNEAKSPPPQKREESAAGLAAEFAHPEWLARRWIDTYGYLSARAICEADQRPVTPALRLNTRDEREVRAIEEELSAAGVRIGPGALLASARRLISGDLVHSPAFREARVAVQDEASQLVAALVGSGRRILDCCAAPGGKTAAMASRNPQAAITAIELHEHRATSLKERLRAFPVEVVTADVTAARLPASFDRVLVDVPCSGTGTLAANPEIKWRLRQEDIVRVKDLQVSILRAGLAALQAGGRLVYSTCSLEPEEGEEVVEQVLTGHTDVELVDCGSVLAALKRSGELLWADAENLVRGRFLRTLPGIHPCDGFFAAVLQKQSA
jgi:16S rRNA (cytosine967-C5)-methyltransferase